MIGIKRFSAVAIFELRFTSLLVGVAQVRRAIGFRSVFLGIQGSGEIEQRRSDVDVADQRIGLKPSARLIGIANDHGDAQAAFVNGGFAAGKCHAMIGSKDDHRFVVEIGFFKNLNQFRDPGIDSRNRLIVLG